MSLPLRENIHPSGIAWRDLIALVVLVLSVIIAVAKRGVRSLLGASLGLAVVLAAPGMFYAQKDAPAKVTYRLFRVRTKSETATIQGAKITSRKKVYQVFRDKQTKAELFRVEIGDTQMTWWNYGITEEDDFNGDGVPDYAWYGGDDTSQEEYVFLSSDSGYRRLDVYKTMQREWARTFHSAAPDFRDLAPPLQIDKRPVCPRCNGIDPGCGCHRVSPS
jgi:hypothetical protein